MRLPEFFYHQSGVIPYRILNGKIEILLITSRAKGKWIIPKGIIEVGFSSQKSAMKEAMEEAGVLGEINGGVVARYEVQKWDDICHVELFLMKVTKTFDMWEEDSFRKRKWVELKKVNNYIKKKPLKKIFVNLNKDLTLFNTI